MSKKQIVSLLGFALLGTVLTPQYSAKAVPVSLSNLFILDVSGSINSAELWKSLRASVISKLGQPFGNPNPKARVEPIDLSITSIERNSANSPIFTIVSKSDAKEIWGMIFKIFPGSSDARLKAITKEIFEDGGAWLVESKVFNQPKLSAPNFELCKKSALVDISQGSFLGSISKENKLVMATAICDKIVKISKNLMMADAYFSKSICKQTDRCSDIAGAIYRATSFATDLSVAAAAAGAKSSLCIAIASDMLNDAPGQTSTSNLNSGKIARNAKSLDSAKESGIKAAQSIGINFPVNTRVVMVGIGSGNDPLPLERNSYLLAYWNGFFTGSGIQQSNQGQSLNRACS